VGVSPKTPTPLEFDECYSHHFLDMIMQNKKMHVKEIYVIFIHLFDSGILLIIEKGG
jgi:hypothetical protein